MHSRKRHQLWISGIIHAPDVAFGDGRYLGRALDAADEFDQVTLCGLDAVKPCVLEHDKAFPALGNFPAFSRGGNELKM
ncbi:hypothetical protein AGR7A_Lc120553 [Agrobacterium deltaense NCPPB 1641]|uniref:Uncharacterized protein n=1 Tax=Agrobacterium deltaense NCPPB 1641 TaxID=1183425 RepID=A0A1S7TXY0_9HYPH|nr:hypothetical protein AGR7A_Lc120553 [Agrobacterium deltaense NCPPB 1641]